MGIEQITILLDLSNFYQPKKLSCEIIEKILMKFLKLDGALILILGETLLTPES